ncbi:type II toxin-antitoxin system death-on-curing family toxin [Nocardia gipuzkoensis]|uniref:type II toxin-antitoxin system death-on-curing family toxin n=1 Tax=Nocardia gipuzkoensis TaxID=2749991 RepID=UPI003EDED230
MTTDPVYYLTVADLHVIARDAVGNYLVRDHGLLASAAARPQTTVFGTDAYPTLFDKGAALLQSIAGNDPLVDGNKRLAIAAAVVFLGRNGISMDRLDEDRAYKLMMSVASGAMDEVADIAEQLAIVLDYRSSAD